MALTPTALQDKASPTLDAVCMEDLQAAIDSASLYVSAKNWGTRYDDGLFLLAAHFATEMEMIKSSVGGAAGAAGAVPASSVKSEKIKSWSVTYADVNGEAASDMLAATSWGRMFIARRKLVFSVRCI